MSVTALTKPGMTRRTFDSSDRVKAILVVVVQLQQEHRVCRILISIVCNGLPQEAMQWRTDDWRHRRSVVVVAVVLGGVVGEVVSHLLC